MKTFRCIIHALVVSVAGCLAVAATNFVMDGSAQWGVAVERAVFYGAGVFSTLWVWRDRITEPKP